MGMGLLFVSVVGIALVDFPHYVTTACIVDFYWMYVCSLTWLRATHSIGYHLLLCLLNPGMAILFYAG